MARIKWSAIGITDAAGKAGGTIFSHNRGGAYVKNFAKPSNPNSPRQQLIRSWFGSVANAWRARSADEISAWNQAVESFPVKNIFGDNMILSGKALFQKLNMNLVKAGKSIITFPPVPIGAQAPADLDPIVLKSLANVIDTFTVKVNFDETVTGTLMVHATRVMPVSTKVARTDYRIVKSEAISAANTKTVDIKSDWGDIFGEPLKVGDTVYLRVSLVVSSGEESTAAFGTAVAVSGA